MHEKVSAICDFFEMKLLKMCWHENDRATTQSHLGSNFPLKLNFFKRKYQCFLVLWAISFKGHKMEEKIRKKGGNGAFQVGRKNWK